MTKKKLKAIWKPNILEEAKTIGYMEGFSDGRNNLIEELIKFKLLKSNWKTSYNKKTKSQYLFK
jgi:hypothetical protein